MDYYVSTEHFAERMDEHWTGTLGNVSSTTLRKVWKQLAQAFEENISGNLTESNDKWIVVQPPTGSGKTQGAILYNAVLATEIDRSEHPGSLIVTRLIDEADAIAEQINELAGEKVAISHHSKSGTSLDELAEYPTLVVTHRAYELALDSLGPEGTIGKAFSFFHKWNGLLLARHLIIIDECLDIVEESQVSLGDLEIAISGIPLDLRIKFETEYKVLQMMQKNLENQAMNKEGKGTKEMMVILSELMDENKIDMKQLRIAVKKERLDMKILKKSDKEENKRLHYFLDETLKSADVMLKTWIYFANHSGKYTWNTARLLVPEDAKGAVVLDATARTNLVYDLFNNAVVWTPPEGARNYKNVTLHVSREHRVGKADMKKKRNKATAELVANLETKVKDRNVFIVTHQDVEPVLKTYTPNFNMMTGHWGAIQGRNIWRDCDTIVIFGLPYKPGTCTASAFMALQGPKDTEWLNNAERRQFNGHTDIRNALKMGWLVTDIVQSFNRIRCRKVIDDKGNCPPAEGYIMFHNDKEADEVLSVLKREMPGINIVEDWTIEARKKRPKRSNFEEALCMLFEKNGSFRMTKSEIAKRLGTKSGSTMDRLITKAKDPDSKLYKTMLNHQVRLILEKYRSTRRVCFVKD